MCATLAQYGGNCDKRDVGVWVVALDGRIGRLTYLSLHFSI
jgi:hypothetical protein